ncbi:MAG: hypothetical protein KHX29_09410 [Prevotella buccalis]|nr:hypothetical protein [Hoylesella buccalis]
MGSCYFHAEAIETINISNVHDTNMHTTSFSEMTEQVEDDYLVNTSENIINKVEQLMNNEIF